MALNVAHYQSKYGEMPLEDSMAMLNATDIDPERAKLLAAGTVQNKSGAPRSTFAQLKTKSDKKPQPRPREWFLSG